MCVCVSVFVITRVLFNFSKFIYFPAFVEVISITSVTNTMTANHEITSFHVVGSFYDETTRSRFLYLAIKSKTTF